MMSQINSVKVKKNEEMKKSKNNPFVLYLTIVRQYLYLPWFLKKSEVRTILIIMTFESHYYHCYTVD